MQNQQKADEILQYWFGIADKDVIPSQHMLHIWFGEDPKIDEEIKEKFLDEHQNATRGSYENWQESPRGSLVLTILYDQFSRHIYRRTPQAYAQDQKALDICLKGIERQYDHLLSLIERAFFYFPLMHAESLEMQAFSVRAFQMLVSLSFPEARGTFEKFLEYAVRHYDAIRQFGRFPQRNAILGRESTPDESQYLKTAALKWGD